MKKYKLEKIFFINESDLSGVDELVYNPVTGNPADEYDMGSDGGKKQNRITWSGHDDHLHIGTTNRNVMMQIIDKADQMGLKTTENPYAKKDPNGKVDNVHSSGSFHYKTFQGQPVVGAGVDISGDKNTVRELIRWINANYKNGYAQVDRTFDSPPNSSDNTKTTSGSTNSISGLTSGSTTPSVSSTGSKSLSFLSPVLSGLESVGKQWKSEFDKKIASMQKESVDKDKKIISEIDRIKNIMKLWNL